MPPHQTGAMAQPPQPAQQPKKKKNVIEIINPDTGKSIFDSQEDSSKKKDSKDEAVSETKANESATEVSYLAVLSYSIVHMQKL